MKTFGAKQKNDIWNEQDDAFFGSSPKGSSSSSSPIASASLFSRRTTNTNNNTDTGAVRIPPKRNANTSLTTQRKRVDSSSTTMNNLIGEKQKEKISEIAKKASTRISELIENSKEEYNKRYNEYNTSKTRDHQSDNRNTVAMNKNNNNTKRKVHVPTTTVEINTKTIVRTAKNLLVSQVPLPCAYCKAIPLMYQIHPFHGPFQRVCANHDFRNLPKCLACNKFDSKHNSKFHSIGVSESRLCPTCARTAILDDGAARKLFHEVLVFFQKLGLAASFDDWTATMTSAVPVNLVSTEEMNKRFSTYKTKDSADKYGICCWTEMHSPIIGVAAGFIGTASAKISSVQKKFSTKQQKSSSNSKPKLNPQGAGRFVSITQIAALKGLPRVYLGQVLAHEVTHAWLALNPTRKRGVVGENLRFGVTRKIPTLVEEGCCQLVAYLYLDYLLDSTSGQLTSDEKVLVDYCKWSIRTHSIYEYGEGYKQAGNAYNHIIDNGGSLSNLLDYVCLHMSFPPCG